MDESPSSSTVQQIRRKRSPSGRSSRSSSRSRSSSSSSSSSRSKANVDSISKNTKKKRKRKASSSPREMSKESGDMKCSSTISTSSSSKDTTISSNTNMTSGGTTSSTTSTTSGSTTSTTTSTTSGGTTSTTTSMTSGGTTSSTTSTTSGGTTSSTTSATSGGTTSTTTSTNSGTTTSTTTSTTSGGTTSTTTSTTSGSITSTTTSMTSGGSNTATTTSTTTGSTKVSTYTPEDQNFAKFLIFFRNVVTKVLLYVFEKGSGDRLPNESLWDYYQRMGLGVDNFKKGLNGSQQQKIDSDPSGSSFDLTLLYRCLRFGYHKLSPGEDRKWCLKDGLSIESLITIVKNQRNDLAHDQPTFSTHKLAVEMKGLRSKLIQILEYCRTLYGLPDETINQEIAKVKDSAKQHLMDPFNPTTFEEYKKNLIYDAFVDLVKTEGRQEIEDFFEKGPEHIIDPLNHIQKTGPLPLKEIFVDMVRKNEIEMKDEAVSFDDVLVNEIWNKKEKTNSVIVISAPAGAGKTTLTKKLSLDWKNKKSKMKFLVEHDLIIKVECRSRSASSLTELIKILMPETSRNLDRDDLKNTLLDLNVLIIMDGLDELNERSTELFKEVMELKKRCEFTLLITTRPEKHQYLETELKLHDLESKMIHLLGIPQDKIPELCKKYYDQICKNHPNPPEIKHLLDHLKKTQLKLADLWRLPYNLTLITILFIYGNGDIAKINTATRLYREIRNLYRTKLKERLHTKGASFSLDEANLDRKIDHFIYILARESLIALKDDHISLPKPSYDELENVCFCSGMDVKEMAGAFLQPVPDVAHSPSFVAYSFPHKGFQDYFGAHYIWLKLTKKVSDHKEETFMRSIVNMGQSAGVQQSFIDHLLTSYNDWRQKQTGSSSIASILEEIQISCTSDISKYQNLFLCLVGILFLEKDQVNDEHRKELLKLLQKTGIADKKGWISVLNAVECDPFVASFISKECNLLRGNVLIEDYTLTAYISLLKSITTCVTDSRNVNIDLDIKGELDDFIELVELIKQRQFRLRTIVINDNYKEFVTLMKDSKFPSLNPQEVAISIRVSEDLPEIKDLLEEIKGKQLTISRLQLQTMNIKITDNNTTKNVMIFRALPQLMKGAFRGNISIHLNGGCEKSQNILKEIGRNELPVDKLYLQDFFKNPGRSNKEVSEYTDQIIKRSPDCIKNGYLGPARDAVCSIIRQPTYALHELNVSVYDPDSLSAFSASVAQQKHSLNYLGVCVSTEAVVRPVDERIMPLNGVSSSGYSYVDLILPSLTEDALMPAIETATRLMPTHPSRGFWSICFPRPLCGVSQIVDQLPQSGLVIGRGIRFPSALCPDGDEERRRIEEEVKEKTGCLHGIIWGGLTSYANISIDSW